MSTDVREARAEVEELRARVEALETELVEVEAWANEALARAREKTYWLDRWQIDLNELMRRRSADRIRAVARAVRGLRRALLRLKSEYPP